MNKEAIRFKSGIAQGSIGIFLLPVADKGHEEKENAMGLMNALGLNGMNPHASLTV